MFLLVILIFILLSSFFGFGATTLLRRFALDMFNLCAKQKSSATTDNYDIYFLFRLTKCQTKCDKNYIGEKSDDKIFFSHKRVVPL